MDLLSTILFQRVKVKKLIARTDVVLLKIGYLCQSLDKQDKY